MKENWYSPLKKRSRDWLLPVHTVLVVWFFLYIGTILYGVPLVSRFGRASGENKTLLTVFSVLNTVIGLAAWGFLIALMQKP